MHYEALSKSLNTMDSNLFRKLYRENVFLAEIADGKEIKTYEAVMDSTNTW